MQLSLVAVPIGNTDDASPRMQRTLQEADVIYCEDTRKFKDLCRRLNLNIKATLKTLPGQEDLETNWNKEFQRFEKDFKIVLVSDAGTPIVNDPGRGILQAAQATLMKVEHVPGPSAPIAAWAWSGGFGLPFYFAGFAPKAKSTARKQWESFFSALVHVKTFCFFDTRHQIKETLIALQQIGFADRQLFVAREMTKPHEELFSGNAQGALEWISDRIQQDQVGELCLLIEGSFGKETPAQNLTIEELVQIREAPPKEAAKILAKATGLSPRECYHRLITHHE